MSPPQQEDFSVIFEKQNELVAQLEVEEIGVVEVLAECEQVQEIADDMESADEHSVSYTRG